MYLDSIHLYTSDSPSSLSDPLSLKVPLHNDHVGVKNDKSHLKDEEVLIVAELTQHEIVVVKKLSADGETIAYPQLCEFGQSLQELQQATILNTVWISNKLKSVIR